MRVICPNCGSENSPGYEFCTRCGHKLPAEIKAITVSPLQAKCPNCRQLNDPNSKYCSSCGFALVSEPNPIVVQFYPPSDISTRHRLREWWHQVLMHHGRYRSYALFLCLPSDTEAIQYLKEFGKELDMLSGENCLIIALSKAEFKRVGFDDEVWSAAVDEQISGGYSITISQLFGVKFTEFPCIVIFEDIRSPKRIVFTFKGLIAKDISNQMRLIFSLIQQAIIENQKPLDKLKNHQVTMSLQKVRQSMFDKLTSFTGKTFETTMEAWIKSVIK